MAKESMKAREVKRAKLVARYAEKRELVSFRLSLRMQTQSVFTIVARLLVVQRVISVSSVFLVSSSVRWLLLV